MSSSYRVCVSHITLFVSGSISRSILQFDDGVLKKTKPIAQGDVLRCIIAIILNINIIGGGVQ